MGNPADFYAPDPSTELVDRLAVVDLKPGDILVLTHPGKLSDRATRNIVETLKAQFPDNHAIVLEEGLTLGVVRPLPCGDIGTCTCKPSGVLCS